MTARDPRRVDHWRAPLTSGRLEEWQHVLVVTDALVLLLNFSASRQAGRLGGRVIAMCWENGRESGWSGVERPGPIELDPTGCDARFPGARLRVESSGWRVVVDDPALGLTCGLRLAPWAEPMTVHNHPLAPGRPMHWIMYPRLRATGFVTTPSGREVELRSAPAYHDHNWGDFAWGDDFSWTWGVVLPSDPACPYTAVYSDLQDKARGQLRMQHVFVWRDRVAARVAQGAELDVRTAGRRTGRVSCTVPPVMALLAPTLQDLPQRFEAVARGARGAVEVGFDLDDVARIVVPDRHDPLGVVSLNEVTGRARITGSLDGASIAVEGRGVFEFLR